MKIKSYKGMDKNMQCRGFQYESGKTYETERAKTCETGFHACEAPLDVLSYYPPVDGNRFFEVEQGGELSKHNQDSKVASTKLTVGAEIGIPGLVRAHFEYVKTHCTNEEMGADNAALTGGYRSALTGGCSSALTGGYRSALTGGDSSALTGGQMSVVYGGEFAKVRGGEWSVLALQHWVDGDLVGVKTAVVDGETIKADTWYALENGEFGEIEE
jgi:hypothetical protein